MAQRPTLETPRLILRPFNLGNRRAETGYWIGVPFWGRGYCTEAGWEVVRYGFEQIALDRIYAHHFTGTMPPAASWPNSAWRTMAASDSTSGNGRSAKTWTCGGCFGRDGMGPEHMACATYLNALTGRRQEQRTAAELTADGRR